MQAAQAMRAASGAMADPEFHGLSPVEGLGVADLASGDVAGLGALLFDNASEAAMPEY